MATQTRTVNGRRVTTYVGESNKEFADRQRAKLKARRRGDEALAQALQKARGTQQVEALTRIGGLTVSQPELFTESGEKAKSRLEVINGETFEVTEGFSRADLVKRKALQEADKRETARLERLSKLDSRTSDRALSRLGVDNPQPTQSLSKKKQPSTGDVIEAIRQASQVNELPVIKTRDAPLRQGVKVQELYEFQDLQRAKRLQGSKSVADNEKGDVKALASKLYRGRLKQEADKRSALNRALEEVKRLESFNDRQAKNVNRILDAIDWVRVNVAKKDKFFNKNEAFGRIGRKVAENLNQYFNPYVIVNNLAGVSRIGKELSEAGVTKEIAKAGLKLTGKASKEIVNIIRKGDKEKARDYLNKGVKGVNKLLQNVDPKTEKGLVNIITLSAILRADKLAIKGVGKIAKTIKNNKNLIKSLGVKAIFGADDLINAIKPSRLLASKSGRAGLSSASKKTQRIIRKIKKPVSKVEKGKRSRASKLNVLTPQQASQGFKSPRQASKELKKLEVDTLVKQSFVRQGRGVKTPTEGQLVKRKKDRLLSRLDKQGDKITRAIKEFEFQSFKASPPKKKSVKITKKRVRVETDAGGGLKNVMYKTLFEKQKFDRARNPSIKTKQAGNQFLRRVSNTPKTRKEIKSIANKNNINFVEDKSKKGFDRNKLAIERLKAKVRTNKKVLFQDFLKRINKKVSGVDRFAKIKRKIKSLNKIRTGLSSVNVAKPIVKTIARNKRKFGIASNLANKLIKAEKQENMIEQASKIVSKLKPIQDTKIDSVGKQVRKVKVVRKKPSKSRVFKPSKIITKPFRPSDKIKKILPVIKVVKKKVALRKPLEKKKPKKLKIKVKFPKSKTKVKKLKVFSNSQVKTLYTPTLAGGRRRRKDEDKLRYYSGAEIRL